MAESGGSDEAFEATAEAPKQPTATPTPDGLQPGAHLGKYKLERVLGEGGMGVVWAAQDPDLERAVAIKLLRYEQASVQLRQRLLREARAMAKLKHPNVLTVYEVGTFANRDYIAMELVDGQTLNAWFQHATPDERWNAVIAAGRGLAAAHAAGVVHRDFKPHNVLRSREGRVLVTDFGLARGLVGEGESPAAPASDAPLPDAAISPYDDTITPPARPANVSDKPVSKSGGIDTPLTQTGALIGTPAYMAPEQFAGGAPDPRTDQFAFCITVWQALTGSRPFVGGTLDELRKSVGAGVAHIQAKMPGGVRAVLTRGLDPDASKRWSSLEDLLDALEDARMRPIRRRRLAFTLFGMAAAVVLFISMRRTGPTKSAQELACEHPEALYAQAWTKTNEPTRIANAFDQYGKRWIDAYTQVCRLANPQMKTAQIACLEAARDDVSALALVIRNSNQQFVEQFDSPAMLPNLKACQSANPLTPVIMPRQEPARTKSIAVAAQVASLRRFSDEELAKNLADLETQARAAGGAMFAQTVIVNGGNEYLRRRRYDEARKAFDRFLALPPERNQKLEAIARLGQLECSQHVLASPHAKLPAQMSDPHGKPVMHPELATLIMAARSASATDDGLLGAVAMLEAVALLQLGQWNRYKSAYDDAIAASEKARRHFEAAGDVRRMAATLAQEADIYLARGDEHAYDDASFAARQAEDVLEKAGLPTYHHIDEIRAQIAFARREYADAHRIYDALGSAHPAPTTKTITGKVAGAAGKSVTVIAWKGDLVGDRVRAYTDPRRAELDTVQTDSDGGFTIPAEPGWAVIAETKGMRSRPALVGTQPVTLTLLPTTSLSGTATGKNLFGVHAYAEYKLGAAGPNFIVEAPVDRDETYDLAGLIQGMTPELGLYGPAGDGMRSVLGSKEGAHWPSGQAIEVIVRGADHGGAYIIGGKLSPKTRAELAVLAEAASCDLGPIGADNTDAGRDVYEAGDVHCTITGNADGAATACADVDGKVFCTNIDVKTTVDVDYPDGRHAGGVTPVLLRLIP